MHGWRPEAGGLVIETDRGPVAAGRLVHVLPGHRRGSTPIHAVYPSRRILAPKVRAFVEFSAEVMNDVA